MAKKKNKFDAIIEETAEVIRTVILQKVDDDETFLNLFGIYLDAIWQRVHSELEPKHTPEAEEELRDILSKHVIGYSNVRAKQTYLGAIKPLQARILTLNKRKNINTDLVSKYIQLYDDFMALAAMRSYKHFCIYMQSVFGFTLWEDTENVFNGYWYYAGRMILDGEYSFLEKQLPTGYGKSLSDAFMMAFIFGINIDNDILKVCGNANFIQDAFDNVIKIMTSPKYAKVFDYYAQFKCDRNAMYTFCKSNDRTFQITGSVKSTNLRVVTKNMDCNGVRARYLFLDDITQRSDAGNLEQHKRDIHAFEHEWFERNYNRNDFHIIASGTTYSQFDILSHLFNKMGGLNAVKSPVNKYTRLGISDAIKPDGKSVFVVVPLLDYDTDESTYPKKISTKSARLKRETNPAEFLAMDQQTPLPPESSPFYYTKLRQYDVIPAIGEHGRTQYCKASLDPKRRGKDYVSMPIFTEVEDFEHGGEKVHYLVDWFYDDRPMQDCLSLIASKIKQHNIVELYVERNTDECISVLLETELKRIGYNNCTITDVYSTQPKDQRILHQEGNIKSKMIFPRYGLYSASNDIGNAMLNVYGYSYTGRVLHDDAPDSLALYSKKFIDKSTMQYATVTTFYR